MLIALAGFAVYWPALGGEFVWDDLNLVRDNTHITSWRWLPRLFAEPIGGASGVHYSFYRPLQMLSYMADHAIWGANPAGYHLSSILVHVLAACAVFGLVREVTTGGRAVALLSALLFVVHPVHTEAVCYIAGRADPLAALFLLGALHACIRSAGQPTAGRRTLAVALYAAAILSKESAVILPAIVLVHAVAFRRLDRPLLFMLAAAGAAYAVLRVTLMRSWIVYETGQGSFWDRAPGALASLAAYVRVLVIPLDLHMEYGHRMFTWLQPEVLAGLLLLTGLLGLLALLRRGLAVFALGWFLVALLPVSNLYLINAFMAEHWLYVPSIGVFLLVARGLCAAAAAGRQRTAWPAGIALLGVYGLLTWRQCAVWNDPVRLYRHTLAYAPDSVAVNVNLAHAYRDRGENDAAAAQIEHALALAPGQPRVQLGAGVLYLLMSDDARAEAALRRSLMLDPALGAAHNNLAVLAFKRGDLAAARRHAAAAKRLGCPPHPGFDARLNARDTAPPSVEASPE